MLRVRGMRRFKSFLTAFLVSNNKTFKNQKFYVVNVESILFVVIHVLIAMLFDQLVAFCCLKILANHLCD